MSYGSLVLMGVPTVRASYRISFTDFIADPDDEDCQRRAATISASRITFADSHLILWVGDMERVRFPMEAIKSVEVVQAPVSRQREDPDQLRARYPNIGEPWSRADDDKLLALYRAGQKDHGTPVGEFGRQPGTIRSCLAKLGWERL
ncbi:MULTISPECIES: hypothetical protein [Streptomyces]|uniref:hypothetical protein n=1 Tax=Streptomyces TaxID=1883 RepID=UPI000687ABF0|nr:MULTISPECIES: hypothetical protein [Streptomyces]MBZ6114301.1 hypothetical protein [Streptomyces olivaceus]MBZ6128105.1 hypothetical protein [Streptomyces olivaceus]MBZ6149006.1 hypothetical protein [Streptomyces olivaceus]MBZ6162850.1 hypothetical protein [Streptomyces olivaceus]MBZ6190653.1 hypothetical protein [Streptomyces olivaceus]